ncbi:hypothetical protein F4811DRAFT_530637 [Daldinia bambusicola]|nr:hypothetical protein F4811DRAFT_530637 [Daldinia bambusicola]
MLSIFLWSSLLITPGRLYVPDLGEDRRSTSESSPGGYLRNVKRSGALPRRYLTSPSQIKSWRRLSVTVSNKPLAMPIGSLTGLRSRGIDNVHTKSYLYSQRDHPGAASSNIRHFRNHTAIDDRDRYVYIKINIFIHSELRFTSAL